jgi:hypothetical protein
MQPSIRLLLPCIFLASACAAPETKYKPVVTVQDAEQRQQQLTPPSAYSISPPSCQEVEMPLYPSAAFAAKLPPVLVRVDFVVAEDGSTHSVTAGMLSASEFGSDFEAAAVEAVSGWTCRPAYWINEEPGGNWGPVHTEQAAYVIFQFDREAIDQRATFGQEQQP